MPVRARARKRKQGELDRARDSTPRDREETGNLSKCRKIKLNLKAPKDQDEEGGQATVTKTNNLGYQQQAKSAYQPSTRLLSKVKGLNTEHAYAGIERERIKNARARHCTKPPRAAPKPAPKPAPRLILAFKAVNTKHPFVVRVSPADHSHPHHQTLAQSTAAQLSGQMGTTNMAPGLEPGSGADQVLEATTAQGSDFALEHEQALRSSGLGTAPPDMNSSPNSVGTGTDANSSPPSSPPTAESEMLCLSSPARYATTIPAHGDHGRPMNKASSKPFQKLQPAGTGYIVLDHPQRRTTRLQKKSQELMNRQQKITPNTHTRTPRALKPVSQAGMTKNRTPTPACPTLATASREKSPPRHVSPPQSPLPISPASSSPLSSIPSSPSSLSSSRSPVSSPTEAPAKATSSANSSSISSRGRQRGHDTSSSEEHKPKRMKIGASSWFKDCFGDSGIQNDTPQECDPGAYLVGPVRQTTAERRWMENVMARYFGFAQGSEEDWLSQFDGAHSDVE